MLTLENVSKTYNKQKVINNINLTVPDNYFVSIVGKSGSGKSTLLNIIGGLERTDTGRIIFDGEDISLFDSKKMAQYHNQVIGFVFQSFHLDPNYTVFQNVEIPLLISKRKVNRKDTVCDVLRKVGLEDKINAKVTKLSGGECQRVCIARAIINKPKLILADEPCGNLDSITSSKIINILREIVCEGQTVLLVTHNMDDAKKTDRIITISDGIILSDTRSCNE